MSELATVFAALISVLGVWLVNRKSAPLRRLEELEALQRVLARLVPGPDKSHLQAYHDRLARALALHIRPEAQWIRAMAWLVPLLVGVLGLAAVQVVSEIALPNPPWVVRVVLVFIAAAPAALAAIAMQAWQVWQEGRLVRAHRQEGLTVLLEAP